MSISAEAISSNVQQDRAIRTGYAKLVAAIWKDNAVLEALQKDPAKVLASYGLPVKAGASVNVEVVTPTGEGSIQSINASWILGQQTGKYTLWIPTKISGPVAPELGTTCTPCCTCT